MTQQIVVRPEDADRERCFNAKGKMVDKFYAKELVKLQIELAKLQKWVKESGNKVLIILEGRDGAGKGGTIKALTEHLNPRVARVSALAKPSDVEQGQWYFQRYFRELPNSGEIVFFDRSWYNRAGVERVMGFCNHEQYKEFIYQVPNIEQMLLGSGFLVFKYFLDVGQDEQSKRILSRKTEPLKMWKLSPIDEESLNLWDQYTEAFQKMFSRTHTPYSPWIIVDSNDKKRARINLTRDLLAKIDYEGKDQNAVCLLADPGVVSPYSQATFATEPCQIKKVKKKKH
ncbi:polyphosphate kinase 2 [Chrysiogenes arsenatis]|uniref:polyphosphate kinase 2 n=1 Tax=Chrysiogenes arsenatis TaxID=309797 RepID=UPI0003F8E8D4|nr:polyphosphate kinase 2 [Chrysiogenes arsenatis]